MRYLLMISLLLPAMATAEDNLYQWYPITISDRGDGALGSTDKKSCINPTCGKRQYILLNG